MSTEAENKQTIVDNQEGMYMRKIMKKTISYLLALAMLLTCLVSPEITAEANSVENNYAKLLQYSLYFYDANMCGADVSAKSMLDWRGNCHTSDRTSYTRSDGSIVSVDLTGGFHDAGDHVKFGLPEAYAAFVLGMSYDTDRTSYTATGQTGHLKNITTHFADYLVKCTVLSSDGNSVEAFCCQVGQGGSGYDHGYWGAPENQTASNRPIYFTSAAEPSTDIVSLSAAALAMQYKNFGGDNYLSTAKKLFNYAKNNNKAVNRTASGFYNSSGWEDDYCLAALMLYKVTGDAQYITEFNKYASSANAQKPYWPLGWDNVGPAVAYYNGNSGALSIVMNISNGNSNNGYRCVDDWGSTRYNTSMQYTGLLYDKMTSSNTYRVWAENQMSYILGNNSMNKCFVVGFNDKSAKYPHHRAASGYTGGPQGTTTQTHVLTGALVGGPKLNGSYTDSASDYVCNEVAIDYNATLVAAAAALYNGHIDENDTQYIDNAYYAESTATAQQKPATVYNGVDYSAVYDYDYYIAHNADVKAAFGNDSRAILQHFVTYGMNEGRRARADFNVYAYANRYADLRNAFGSSVRDYYIHYINFGVKENRIATGNDTKLNIAATGTSGQSGNNSGGNNNNGTSAIYNGVNYSPVYDYNYYVSNNPDVKRAYGNNKADVLRHFVIYGMSEGRQGCAGFNVKNYAYRYADLRNVFGSNLKLYYIHYINYGRSEGRTASTISGMQGYRTVYNGVDYSLVYDYNYYVNHNADIKKAFGVDDAAVLRHFVTYGMKEGRQAKESFNVFNYRSRYTDLQRTYGNNLNMYYLHYIRYGKSEGRAAR